MWVLSARWQAVSGLWQELCGTQTIFCCQHIMSLGPCSSPYGPLALTVKRLGTEVYLCHLQNYQFIHGRSHSGNKDFWKAISDSCVWQREDKICRRWLARCNFFHHQKVSLPCFVKSFPSLVLALQAQKAQVLVLPKSKIPDMGWGGTLIWGQTRWDRSQGSLLWCDVPSHSLFSPPLSCKPEEQGMAAGAAACF